MAKREMTFLRGTGKKSRNEAVVEVETSTEAEHTPIDFSGLFDLSFYLSKHPEITEQDIDPLEHYLEQGWLQGYDPSENFSTRYYLRTNPDVAESGHNPLTHYILHGQEEGRQPLPPPKIELPAAAAGIETNALFGQEDTMGLILQAQLRAAFDTEFYETLYEDLITPGSDAFTHYMHEGWKLGCDPSRDFSTDDYLQQHPDVARDDINPLLHHIMFRTHKVGTSETLPLNVEPAPDLPAEEIEIPDVVRAAFDADFYKSTYPDIDVPDIDPLKHYMEFGWKELRDPSKTFSTNGYLQRHPILAIKGINPFTHYVLNGDDLAQSHPIDKSTSPQSENISEEAEAETNPPIEIPDEVRKAFDEDFYKANYLEINSQNIDALEHYMEFGWKDLHDPSPYFSTEYYLENNPDIAKAGVNPFSHYCTSGIHEKREPKSYADLRAIGFNPLVSVIIPNYNHAKYLPQRLQCIFDQTYKNIEIIILDDCSKDDSRKVIKDIIKDRDEDITIHFNEKNSGNVFSQWQTGLSLAKGDLIWICESDDYAELDFLEKMVRHFSDESVGMAFGGIQFCDTDGSMFQGLDPWRERADPGIWNGVTSRPAAQWFANGWGVNNLYANVGGGIFRNQKVDAAIWKEAKTYKICGDWYLYLQLAGGGQIVSDPEAVAYFRQHGENTSAANFNKTYYYDEHVKIMRAIIDKWGIPTETRERFIENIKFQYNHFEMDEKNGPFDSYFPIDEILARERKQEHIQIFFLGFHEGGGELFPIMMANGFKEAGYTVSMVGVELGTINEDIRNKLKPGIGVYHISDIVEHGRAEFFKNCGTSVIHTHMISCDAKLASLSDEPFEIPYVVSLHGSYESMAVGNEAVLWKIMRNVTQWVYTADKNLGFVKGMPLDPSRFHKIPNAMPRDDREFAKTRKDLGISEDAVVFTLVARGIKQKGWRASVEAFQSLAANNPKKDMHLILVGTGEEADKAGEKVAKAKNITWLGYQSNINGLYRMSDCAIVPTRFGGESFPLCIIQALQEELPVIATDNGEIKSMLTHEDGVAGVLIENERDTQQFFILLETAMKKMLTKTARKKAAKIAGACAKKFDMNEMLDAYTEIYDKAKRHIKAEKAGDISILNVED